MTCPKDAEIARLKAELDGARNELALVRQDFARASTSAANARRVAFEEARNEAARMRMKSGKDEMLFLEMCGWCARQRDASQPVAETPTCSEPGCGQCACQSSRVQTVAEAQTPKLFVGVDRGSPNGDQAALVEMEQQPDGSMLVTRSLQGKEAEAEVARREQPPARDVEGLARIFRETIDRARGEVLATDDVIAMLCARAAIAHLDGGPRT